MVARRIGETDRVGRRDESARGWLAYIPSVDLLSKQGTLRLVAKDKGRHWIWHLQEKSCSMVKR